MRTGRPDPCCGGHRRCRRSWHESSITAFQAKYLLRVFLRQFRDPAQAFEELNEQLAAGDRTRSSSRRLSSCSTPRPAPALRIGRTSAVLLVPGGRRAALRSTGPLLMLDPKASYSREIPMESGDLVVMHRRSGRGRRRSLLARTASSRRPNGARGTARRALQGPARCR